MMKSIALSAATIAFALMPRGDARAADCSGALVPSITSYSTSKITRLAIAANMTQESYEKAKKDAGGSAIISGVPAGANYNEFRSNVFREAKSLKLDNFENTSASYATSGIGKEALEAYKSCLAASRGLHLITEQIGADHYKIAVIYTPMPDMPSLLMKLVDVSNVSEDSRKSIERQLDVKTQGTIDKQISIRPLDPDKETSISVAVGGGLSRSALLPRLVAPTPPPRKSLTAEAYNGKPVIITFFTSACAKINFGTLQCGYNYSAQYNRANNSWSVTGYNLDTRGNGTWSYNNAPKRPGNISTWGMLHTFDESGNVYHGKSRVGSISLAQ